jgi:hypothetical protein
MTKIPFRVQYACWEKRQLLSCYTWYLNDGVCFCNFNGNSCVNVKWCSNQNFKLWYSWMLAPDKIFNVEIMWLPASFPNLNFWQRKWQYYMRLQRCFKLKYSGTWVELFHMWSGNIYIISLLSQKVFELITIFLLQVHCTLYTVVMTNSCTF